MKNISLWQLKYFLDAVNLGGVGKAASQNHITHAAVSHAIKRLENEIGVSLISHQKRRFNVTPVGRLIAEEADKLLGALDKVVNTVSLEANLRLEHLRIGSSHSIYNALVLEKISLFKKHWPSARIELHLGRTPELAEMMKKNTIDLAISFDDGSLNDFESKALARSRFCVIEPLSAVNKKLPYVLTKPRPETLAFRRWVNENTLEKENFFSEIDSWELIVSMVALGLGRGLVPRQILAPRAKVRVKKTSFDFPIDLIAFWPKGDKLSLDCMDFLALFK